MITVGDLDTPVALQYKTFAANSSYGGIQNATWSNAVDNAGEAVGTVWAAMLYKGGRESDEGEQKVGEQKVLFFIRYETFKDRIQPDWRIKVTQQNDNTKYFYYYIQDISVVDGRHKMVRLTTIMKDNE